MARIGIIQVAVAALAAFAGTDVLAELKDGTSFGLGTVPKELVKALEACQRKKSDLFSRTQLHLWTREAK